ncbi:TetR/AcrR family transcriptional regulator [Arthrobacter sp. NyZ413]|uniref:TetR/AcrR family transcriptional regulator n=1 Tax=Arthrobacter sp. NyZ413 TaxID=3144669 RepID=UPI003BF8E5E8
MPRPKKAEQNGRATGELIYEASVELMHDRGFHGTSMRDVAKEVGIQMSTLYYYYESKQALLYYIMTRVTNALADMVRASISTETDPISQLESAVTAHIEFHARQPKEAHVAETELRYLEPDKLKSVIEVRDEYEEIFASILRAGQATGDFAPVDIRIAVRAMLVSLTDVATWFKPGGRLKLDEVSAFYRQIFIEGVKVRSRGALNQDWAVERAEAPI